MRILVTGTAGFIASHLALKLHSDGHDVVGVDKKEHFPIPSYKIMTIDLAEWDQVAKLGRFDVIFHLAGHSAGDLSIKNYEEDIGDNLLSTAHIIKHAQQTGVKQVIYASSMAVYGDQEKYPVNETATPKPHVYYGANKLASELYLKIANTTELSTTSIRFFNIYGPGQDIRNLNQGMVRIFIGELMKNKHFEMRGSPERYRDFLYISDTIDGLIACLGNKNIAGEVINLASGTTHTLGELLELIRQRLPFKTTISFTNPTSFDLNRMHGDITKAKKLLNFNPKIDLPEGLDIMIKWVLENSKK